MTIFFIAAIALFSLQNISFKQFNLVYMKNTASYFIFNAIYFTLICAMYLVLGVNTSNFEPSIAGLGLLFAVSFISAMYFYMKAMENGPLGLSFLFFSSGMLLPILFGIIFYGEPAPLHRFVGLILLFAAFSISTLGKGGGKMSKKWVTYILLGSMSNGVIGIALKLCRTFVSEDAMIEFLFLGFGQAAIISLIIGTVLIGKYKMQISHFRAAPFVFIASAAAVSTAWGNYMMVFLSLNVTALVQFPVINGSLVITSILTSRIVYKEQITKLHLLTIFIGLISIVMLSL